MGKAVYNDIAKFYDGVLGKFNEPHGYIRKKINKFHTGAKTLLELGCGTGNNILILKKYYEVSGMDISEQMLKIAVKKNPTTKFYLQDMKTFSIDKKFDVILCLYDTINHLTLFSDWKKLFNNVCLHLNKNGVFIFDINTLFKLRIISEISPFINKSGLNYLIFDVKKISANVFNWNIKIFENKNGNKFNLCEVNIKESSFETTKIINEARKYFLIKTIEEENGKKANAESERIYFVCQKK